jgi:cyclase
VTDVTREHPEHLFELRTVADGVHIAVARPVYRVNCNTVLVETGDGVLVVDSHSKPSAARAIIRELAALTPRPVRYVVNTHFHWDHWHGNEAYPAAYPHVEVITNDITREAMLRRGLKRIQDHVRSGPAEIAALRSQLGTVTDPDHRVALLDSLRQAEAYQAEVAALRPALPTMVFERTMRLFRGNREIQLLHLGRAHTEGDVFVFLPKEKLVVTGDAVIGWTPFMGDGYPEDWVGTLDRLAGLDFTTMLMGHGEPAGRDWLRLFRGYVHDLVGAVRREALRGATLDEAKQRVPDALSPAYEAAFSTYGHYRPWRQLVLGNIERAFAAVS